MKKVLILFYFFFSTSFVAAQSATLEPFDSWIKGRENGNWGADPSELGYVSVRCGALFGVVGAVFSNLGKSEEDKTRGLDIKARAISLIGFGNTMAETVGWSNERSSKRLQVHYGEYQKIIASNREIHNNMFHGFVQGDYKFCVEYEIMLKEVAVRVNKK